MYENHLYLQFTLFKNKRFILNLMPQQNASKFAIFYKYKNPKLIFPFFILCYLIFFSNGLCSHRPGNSLGEKSKVAWNEKWKNLHGHGYLYSKIMENFEAFSISSSINLLFLKSECQISLEKSFLSFLESGKANHYQLLLPR